MLQVSTMLPPAPGESVPDQSSVTLSKVSALRTKHTRPASCSARPVQTQEWGGKGTSPRSHKRGGTQASIGSKFHEPTQRSACAGFCDSGQTGEVTGLHHRLAERLTGGARWWRGGGLRALQGKRGARGEPEYARGCLGGGGVESPTFPPRAGSQGPPHPGGHQRETSGETWGGGRINAARHLLRGPPVAPATPEQHPEAGRGGEGRGWAGLGWAKGAGLAGGRVGVRARSRASTPGAGRPQRSGKGATEGARLRTGVCAPRLASPGGGSRLLAAAVPAQLLGPSGSHPPAVRIPRKTPLGPRGAHSVVLLTWLLAGSGLGQRPKPDLSHGARATGPQPAGETARRR